MGRRLEAKVAIVTGSASGIGRECAMALAREGASVVIADLDVEGSKSVSDQITDLGGRAHIVQVDMGDRASVQALVQQTVEEFGRLNILHNNAAATHLAATRDLNVADMDPEVWDSTMRINLTGTMLATKFALPHLISAGGGSIVNTSSGASLGGDLGHTAYAVSKAAINALTVYTAAQYGKAGVRCNAIAPGLIVTPASAGNYAGPNGEMMLRHHLTPRLGLPADIASMLVYLCSPDAGFINGQIINVDGGAGSHQPYLADILALQKPE
ncbi:MAG TPA: SDR family oxidoreductase [Actinomycetes bacterium]|jgi:NAD(P)-dependent dehydrogenase (short-subunit alcohol dehydrogenase family)|nr:SDR family oxidoreductase [Actinomycetes bacterium]